MKKNNSLLPSRDPPKGISINSVPQFVSFSFDDNGYSGLKESGLEGGMRFVLDLFSGKKNPLGAGNKQTFDALPIKATFFLKGDNCVQGSIEDNSLVKAIWHEAKESGHELGIHTFSHPHGIEIDWLASPPRRNSLLTKEDWTKEIEACISVLVKPWNSFVKKDDDTLGIGIERNALTGFRSPYLEYNSELIPALMESGFLYDASIEEGWQTDLDGSSLFWPYTLNNGSPGDAWTSKDLFKEDPSVEKHQGFFIMPIYVLTVPPDSLCETYGTRIGFRKRMKKEQECFNELCGKITGVDWNIWFEYFMAPDDALACLKYSFDLRLNGNRCPFLLALHSDIYSDLYDLQDLEGEDPERIKANSEERRNVLTSFVEYVLSYEQTRVLTLDSLRHWLENPGPLADG